MNESGAVSYAIESQSRNLTELTKLTNEQIIPAIAKQPGVLRVDLLGAAATQQGATLVRFNGKDALAVQVIKRGDANTLEVVSRVENQVQQLRSTLGDVQLTLAATQAEYIRKATDATIDALIEAIILAVIVIFPFLLELASDCNFCTGNSYIFVSNFYCHGLVWLQPRDNYTIGSSFGDWQYC